MGAPSRSPALTSSKQARGSAAPPGPPAPASPSAGAQEPRAHRKVDVDVRELDTERARPLTAGRGQPGWTGSPLTTPVRFAVDSAWRAKRNGRGTTLNVLPRPRTA